VVLLLLCGTVQAQDKAAQAKDALAKVQKVVATRQAKLQASEVYLEYQEALRALQALEALLAPPVPVTPVPPAEKKGTP
jgi:hypothetical protein